jgi:hypothetical protein
MKRTKEELDQLEALMEKRSKAVDAAYKDAKEKGFKRGNGGQGQIKCPCCESGTLHYKVSAYNGHLWGRCSTEGCVAWVS